MSGYKIEISKPEGFKILQELEEQGYIKIIEKTEPNAENYLEMMARLKRFSPDTCGIESVAQHIYDTKKRRHEL